MDALGRMQPLRDGYANSRRGGSLGPVLGKETVENGCHRLRAHGDTRVAARPIAHKGFRVSTDGSSGSVGTNAV